MLKRVKLLITCFLVALVWTFKFGLNGPPVIMELPFFCIKSQDWGTGGISLSAIDILYTSITVFMFSMRVHINWDL